jgi:O-antigen ligase
VDQERRQSRLGGIGLSLAIWGAFAFAAVSGFSIVAYEVAFGVTVIGLILAFASGRITYRRTACDLPLLALVAADLLACAFSVHPLYSLKSMRGEWVLLFYPVFVQTFRDTRTVRTALKVLLISSSIVAIYAIAQMFTGVDLLRRRTLEPIGNLYIATGLFGHHLSYGGHVLITGAIAFVLAMYARTRQERIVHALIATIQFGGIVASFARTAWAGFLATIAGTAIAARGLARRAVIAAAVAGVVVAALIPSVRARLSVLGQFGDDPRVRLWRTSIEIWRHHPIFGSGMASFASQFPIYRVPGEYMSTAHPHNDILNIMVNSGLVGLTAFASIWIFFFRLTSSARRILPDADPRRGVLLAGMLAVAAILVGGLGQCFMTNEKVASLFWFVVAATVAVAHEVKAQRDGPVRATGRREGEPRARA